MRTPAAVLWDMDGTLVDTEPYWIRCEFDLVAEFGGTWTDDDARALIGADLIDAATVLRDRGGVQLEPVEIVERLLDGVVARVEERLPWRPGARELLAACGRSGLPCALVTMSWRRCADAVMRTVPVGSFELTITGDEVTKGKPHPEPYEEAARRLGVSPFDCVAIEDSRTGVASALAAGCATLGVPHVVTLEPATNLTLVESLADVSVEDLHRLLS